MTRTTLRTGLVGMAAASALVLLAPSAHAAVSTFSGGAVTNCDRPAPPPSGGTSTGNGACDTTGIATTCITSVNTPEATVATTCKGNLDADTSLLFVQFRASEQQAVQVFCFGSGSGTFTYRASPTSPEIPVPVTVSVSGQTAQFGGVAVFGVSTVVVSGTYTAACGGNGSYAGQTL